MVEGPESATGMVKYPIQHDTEPFGMGRFQQQSETIVSTKKRVNLHKIEGVVPVVRGRGKDRIQVQCIYTQVRQIVQLFYDPVKVSTLKVLKVGRTSPGLKFYSRWQRWMVSTVKTVWKNLIKNSVSDPIGCLGLIHR